MRGKGGRAALYSKVIAEKPYKPPSTISDGARANNGLEGGREEDIWGDFLRRKKKKKKQFPDQDALGSSPL